MARAVGSKPVSFSPPIANKILDQLDLQEQSERLGKAGPASQIVVSQTSVKARNTSGGDLLRGACLNISGNLLSEYDSTKLWFGGVTPTGSQQFGILRRATPNGEIAELQVSGVCLAQVNVISVNHNYAEPVNGTTVFRSAETGPLLIMHKPSLVATGEMEATVCFRGSPGMQLFRFELYTNLDLGGEAFAYIVEWDGGYAATATEIVVKDFTSSPGAWQGVAGFRGWCTLPPDNDDGKYEIVWMETFAKFIEFTATEDMGYSSTGQMAVTVNAAWDGKTPTSSPVIVIDPRGLFSRVLSGAKGKAVYDPERDVYVIYECQSKAGWIRGTLTAAVSSGSSSSVTVSAFGGTQQDVQDPGAVTVYDPQGLFTRAMSGAKFLAIYDAVTDRYNLVECQSKAGWIRFVLTGDMTAGSATSTTTQFGGSQQDVQDPGNVDVKDPGGLFSRAITGAVGKAIYNATSDEYVIVECQQITMAISGDIPDIGETGCGLLAGTTSFTIDSANVEVMNGPPFDLSPTGELTIHNPFGFSAAVGAYFHAVWHETKERWELYQVVGRCAPPEGC